MAKQSEQATKKAKRRITIAVDLSEDVQEMFLLMLDRYNAANQQNRLSRVGLATVLLTERMEQIVRQAQQQQQQQQQAQQQQQQQQSPSSNPAPDSKL